MADYFVHFTDNSIKVKITKHIHVWWCMRASENWIHWLITLNANIYVIMYLLLNIQNGLNPHELIMVTIDSMQLLSFRIFFTTVSLQLSLGRLAGVLCYFKCNFARLMLWYLLEECLTITVKLTIQRSIGCYVAVQIYHDLLLVRRDMFWVCIFICI